MQAIVISKMTKKQQEIIKLLQNNGNEPNGDHDPGEGDKFISLPQVVEDRMDNFRMELKQHQEDILKQAKEIKTQFDPEMVDKKISEALNNILKNLTRK